MSDASKLPKGREEVANALRGFALVQKPEFKALLEEAALMLTSQSEDAPSCASCSLWNTYCPTHNVINREGVKTTPCGRCCYPGDCITQCSKPTQQASAAPTE